MRPVTRKGLEDVLNLFEDLGRPVHIGDLKKKYRVITESRSSKKGMTERELLTLNLRRLYKAGRLRKSDRVARVREYPVSPYTKNKGNRVVNVRFYAPPKCAGRTLSFELYFVRQGMLEERPSLTKKEMVVRLLRRSSAP